MRKVGPRKTIPMRGRVEHSMHSMMNEPASKPAVSQKVKDYPKMEKAAAKFIKDKMPSKK